MGAANYVIIIVWGPRIWLCYILCNFKIHPVKFEQVYVNLSATLLVCMYISFHFIKENWPWPDHLGHFLCLWMTAKIVQNLYLYCREVHSNAKEGKCLCRNSVDCIKNFESDDPGRKIFHVPLFCGLGHHC